jgi:hypothetical protein
MRNGTRNSILTPKTPFYEQVLDDGDTGLRVAFIGEDASATITVSSAGDITFKVGDAGSEAVDTTVVPSTGIIDVSVAAYSTFGEIVDVINGSVNWRAYLVGVLRADATDASTGSLLLRTETTLNKMANEIPLYKDTSKVLNLAIRVGTRSKTGGSEDKGAAELYQIISTNTFGSGTSKILVYEIDEKANTETKIYELAGGATTVENLKEFVQNGRGSLAVNAIGKHLLVKMVGSAACTGNLMVIGAVDVGM